jgi:hypothetical protein
MGMPAREGRWCLKKSQARHDGVMGCGIKEMSTSEIAVFDLQTKGMF